ncbi:MAG: homoserine O-acetyltransferase [Planctomycetota bacterium]
MSSSSAGSVGIVQTQYFTFAEGDAFPLDCGKALPGPITVAYETYGELSKERDNAVLIEHALSGDAHVAGRHRPEDRKPGWWDPMIGPGKPIDTNKYFVVCSNALGGCRGTTGPCSINPETGKPYGTQFPIVTVEDMVRLQKELVDHLGIKRLLTVTGGSMAGFQALEWGIMYPDRVASIIPIATCARLSAQAIAFNAVGRNAILSDPNWQGGDYCSMEFAPTKGLAIARMVGHITYLSSEGMREKFGRRLRYADNYQFDLSSEFDVETYLDYQGSRFVERFDANTYLYMTKAMDYFDLVQKYGSLDEAFRKLTCRTMVLSFTSDWLFPPSESQEMVSALVRQGKDVTYCNIESQYGHDAFLLEADTEGNLLSGFLAETLRPGGRLQEVGAKGTGGRKRVLAERLAGKPRVDYDRIVDLIPAGKTVLDLGCGDGELLARLRREKGVVGQGLEISQELIIKCVQRGIPVVQYDIDRGLSEYPDESFDFVVLSLTLQVIRRPKFVVSEMLRVGKACVVSFPNFAYWRARLQQLMRGRSPVTPTLPLPWYDTPNIRYFSIADFRDFCAELGAKVLRVIPLSLTRGVEVRLQSNLLAEEAIFVIAKGPTFARTHGTRKGEPGGLPEHLRGGDASSWDRTEV